MIRKAPFVILSLLVLGLIASLFAYQAQAQIYVGNFLGENIPTFPNNANGNVLPKTNIQGTATILSGPAGVAVDADFIYVANLGNSSIDVSPIDSNGNVAPTRSIKGAATTLNGPQYVVVNSDFIYVANQGNNSIDVFPIKVPIPISAYENMAPIRSIQGAATALLGPFGIALGPSTGSGEKLGISQIYLLLLGDQ